MVGYRGLGFRAWALAGAAIAMIGAPAWANEILRFEIPSQDLANALEVFARQSSQDIVFDARLARGKRAPAVIGPYRPEDALQRLLYGSGLSARRVNANSVIVEPIGPQPLAAAAPAEPAIVEEVVVTGSHIRGAAPVSPLVIVTQDQIRDAGQHDLGEVARSLPQNFAGGQNPGAGARSGAGSANVNGASTLNLRGIGNDATLTLLNGRRLATNGPSGVDITAIPMAAVARLEILTDGASALYGSDAVGGVANVITRTDYQGLEVSGLYGGATDGGYVQRQLSVVGGQTWRDGGVMAAVGWADNGAVAAGQRSYTRTMNPQTDLYPSLTRSHGFVSVRQGLGERLRLGLDGIYNHTEQDARLAYGTGPVTALGARNRPVTTSFMVAPNLELDLAGDWSLLAYAAYGKDRSRAYSETFSGGVRASLATNCYCSVARTAEISLEGPVLALPAGQARLAAGAGFRSARSSFRQFTNDVAGQAYGETDSVGYGFAELDAPLLAKLTATAAVRYEDYNSFGSVTTPKLGLLYTATPALRLSASWGRSFKAPQFYQRYQRVQALLLPASGYGAAFPADATFLFSSGGNPDLKPERASSTTLSADYRPPALPGLTLTASYYRIGFADRVVIAVVNPRGVITNPLYAPFVVANPSAAAQAAVIAAAPQGLLMATPAPYDPSKVVAIVDGRPANASRQRINGFDLAARYTTRLDNGDSVALSASGTYLDIAQALLEGAPRMGLTGNFYQPRHFRARGGGTWIHRAVTLSVFANYMGAARYRDVTPVQPIKATVTVDLVGRWTGPRGLGVSLSLVNAFNAKPTLVPGQPYDTSFDATAYAATGRVAAVSVAKRF